MSQQHFVFIKTAIPYNRNKQEIFAFFQMLITVLKRCCYAGEKRRKWEDGGAHTKGAAGRGAHAGKVWRAGGPQRKNISMIECGVSGISVPTLRRICRVLSISSDDILFGPAQQNSVQALAHRLEHLQASQFELTQDIFNCLLAYFAEENWFFICEENSGFSFE